MISMSSQSRPNQKKRDFEKDIVFWSSSGPKRERSLGKKKIDRLKKKNTSVTHKSKKKRKKNFDVPSHHPQKIY